MPSKRAVENIIAGLDLEQSNRTLAANHIRVVLGDNYLPPAEDSDTDTTGASATTQDDADDTTTPTPDRGAPVEGGGDGIPCVN